MSEVSIVEPRTSARSEDSGTGRAVALWAGAVVAVFIGLFHLIPVPDYLAEGVPYVAVMFLVGGVASFAAAVVMVVPAFPAGLRRLAIALMALNSLLMIVFGVLSRVVGLPGVEGGWDSFILISLAIEAAFLALTPILLRRR